jgi:methylmalonyl-CoA mutase, N-terminal domain
MLGAFQMLNRAKVHYAILALSADAVWCTLWRPLDAHESAGRIAKPMFVAALHGAGGSSRFGSMKAAIPTPRERDLPFHTVSGRPIERLYTPESLKDFDYERDLGNPGRYPYTRGIHPTGYKGKLWTMRQFAGFATPEETNRRYRDLLSAGATGLSVAFDLPTLMGRDPDHPLSLGEVGKCGANVTSLADMEALFDGIPLAEVTTSMTINSSAPMAFAMYLALAERQGVDWKHLSGTIQNDILKEFIAQKEYIYPPRPSVRLITDIFAFCAAHVPRWNTISVSGYHIREAGATAAQELAFTLRNGIEYVQAGVAAGLDADRFVPRMSFFFDVHSDFFEEIAKFRAARRIWSRIMRERFGATDERSLKLRFHSQTAGVSLTAQQPMNNVVRTALQALSAVLGGTNSLHTCSLDEALALPSAEAATLALRTQQILAHETGVTSAIDPFGGSYFVERLTRDLEDESERYFRTIDGMGGMIAAIERGYPQREIAESAYRFQQDVDRKRRISVGVNEFVSDESQPVPILQIDETAADQQLAKVDRLRRTRNTVTVTRALDRLRKAALRSENTMPALLDAVRAYATIGEMCDAFRDVWGEYQEQAII